MTMPGLPVLPSSASFALFGRYSNNQNLIASRVSASIAGLWARMVDPEHFSDSWKTLQPLVAGIIDTHHSMSAADAAQYYELSRSVAGFGGGGVSVVRMSPQYLSTVTNAMGAGEFYHFLDGGASPLDASRMALNFLRGAGVRLVLNGGRDTVIGATSGDGVALGWERIVEPRSCGYCSGLAASSGVHKAETSSKFHAHDYCQCLARVVFQGQSSANEGLASEWSRVTSGKNGKAASAAWEEYWSGKNGSSDSIAGNGTALPANAPEEGASNAPVVGEPVGLA